MLIALVTEFPQDSYFQWREAFDTEMQRKLGVFVKSVGINPLSLREYPENHNYWKFLKNADLVFVYCSRSNFPKREMWDWWKLPIHAKKFMKQEAKMIAQFDQEFIWVFHQDWSWWNDHEEIKRRLNIDTPEKFFNDTQVLEFSDAIFTVLDNPLFEDYTSKPVFYMPLPQLVRHRNIILEPKTNNIALLNHTSIHNSVKHCVKNVIRKLRIPVTVFNSMCFGQPKTGRVWALSRDLESGSKTYGRIEQNKYMEILSSCYCALDDAENYIGWSRFVMECALVKVPCVGSNYANKIFFPELYTKHKDYKTQRNLITKLYSDPEFFDRVTEYAINKIYEHLDTERLCRKLLKIATDIGTKTSDVDVEKYLFLDFLSKNLMRNKLPPPRPIDSNVTVFDGILKKDLSQAEWDKVYGSWERFIDDRKVYKELQRIAMEKDY